MPRPRCSAATATMALLSTYGPACLPPGRPHRFRRPRSRRQGGRGRAAPWPAAACAARSRRSRSCRGRGHAAAPGRSSRSSGWSRTKSPGTMSAAACGSLRKSCRRSPRSPCGMPGTAASHRPFPTARRQVHSVGSKNPSASGAGGYKRGKQPSRNHSSSSWKVLGSRRRHRPLHGLHPSTISVEAGGRREYRPSFGRFERI